MSERTDAAVTGESAPETVKPGSKVHAGELNLTAPVTVEIANPAMMTMAGRDEPASASISHCQPVLGVCQVHKANGVRTAVDTKADASCMVAGCSWLAKRRVSRLNRAYKMALPADSKMAG